MTMKRGACGPRVGTGARLAEEDSLGDMIEVTANAREYSRAGKSGGDGVGGRVSGAFIVGEPIGERYKR